ncbi:sigma-54 interaction domain-containing protein [Anaeromyxobacter paludicola]|uniref:Sigma-54 factor interaction domain-containing protein n=1 Tax=Anaeromyxobacter paludicola TaxID=2918171 RepID=A0ABN6N7E5_9BACT|nr:sigma 54-interacting transcriptional regulator [Anaeromyxobacter paludicola]BDG07964.1 hypothetical protein AMPC_10770 [Anaeromyxobacter paludicola]
MTPSPLPARAAAAAPIARGPAMREVLAALADVAPTPTTVLLLGESGTGKEVLARHVHALSSRAAGPWVAVNCAALPAELLESELFGHERGAFTGAEQRRAGRFEQASGGTLLLDEISELPLGLQAKLLRAIQEREIDRVGGARPVPVDVRIIATSNRDLAEMVAAGRFRSDLYYRLNVFPVVIPPLRERPEDLSPLAVALVAEGAAALGRPAPLLSPDALAALSATGLPGNVRELKNLLERALVRCRGPLLERAHLGLGPARPAAPRPLPAEPAAAGVPAGLPLELAALERLAITEALRRTGGNRTHAARLLGIGLRTLRNKLRAWRLAGEPLPDEAVPAARPIVPGAPCRAALQPAHLLASARARGSHGERA